MDTRQTTLRNFAACPLCGNFLASLLAALGDESLDQAIAESNGTWLEFPWQPSLTAMLTTYYDWHFEAGAEGYSSRCPDCFRRITYLSGATEKQGEEPVAVLQLERRPGFRI